MTDEIAEPLDELEDQAPVVVEVASAPVPPLESYMRVGGRGPQVTLLQEMLIAQGYLDIAAPTGQYGSRTADAVKRVHRDAGCRCGEKISSKGWNFLHRQAAAG